jgi:hypothetical protein
MAVIRLAHISLDLTRANFEGVMAAYVDFSKAGLKGTCFKDAFLPYAKFNDNSLEGNSFEGANLTFSDFDGVIANNPSENPIKWSGANLSFAMINHLPFPLKTRNLTVYGAEAGGADFTLVDREALIGRDDMVGAESLFKGHNEHFEDMRQGLGKINDKLDQMMLNNLYGEDNMKENPSGQRKSGSTFKFFPGAELKGDSKINQDRFTNIQGTAYVVPVGEDPKNYQVDSKAGQNNTFIFGEHMKMDENASYSLRDGQNIEGDAVTVTQPLTEDEELNTRFLNLKSDILPQQKEDDLELPNVPNTNITPSRSGKS